MKNKTLSCYFGLVIFLAFAAWVTQASDAVPKPTITNAVLKYLSFPEPEMDIIGTNFGATQGTKNVQIDGSLISALPGWSVIHWTDTMVTVKTKDIIPWEHEYKIALTEGATVISNVLSKRFPYTIDGVKPTSGPVNSTIKVYVWDLPAAPGGLVVKMGSATCLIVSWGSATLPIEAKVPAVAIGTYSVTLQKGTKVVSNKVSFAVVKFKPPLTPVEKK